MDMSDAFNSDIYVPNVTDVKEISIILQDLKVFDDLGRKQVLTRLMQSGAANKMSIGVKKLLMLVEMARQDEDPVERFIQSIGDQEDIMRI